MFDRYISNVIKELGVTKTTEVILLLLAGAGIFGVAGAHLIKNEPQLLEKGEEK